MGSVFNLNGKVNALPILSFPIVSKLNISVKELVTSSDLMAKAMKVISDETPTLAALAMMDLSIEAECFGAKVTFSENEVPSIDDVLINDIEDAKNLIVPPVGLKRDKLAIEAILKAKEIINKPLIAGAIGPYSLCGRLVGVSEALMDCYEDEDLLHEVLKKCTSFLILYLKAFKEAGASGVILAEPLAGLLSPSLAKVFSSNYVKQIIDAVQDDNFIVIYHNCGDSAKKMISDLVATGAKALHFGNNCDLSEILKNVPEDVYVLGNVDPAGEFANGTKESIYKVTSELLNKCGKYKNFILSSGCDIPPQAKWENINAFYQALKDYNEN